MEYTSKRGMEYETKADNLRWQIKLSRMVAEQIAGVAPEVAAQAWAAAAKYENDLRNL